MGHVGDRLAAQRGVQQIRGDLRVEGHGERLARAARHVRDDELLRLVAHDARPGRDECYPQPRDRVVVLGNQHAAIGARQCESLWQAAHRPRIAHEQGGADLVAIRQPCHRVGRVLVGGLEAVQQRRVRHRGPQCRGQIHRPGRGLQTPTFGGAGRHRLVQPGEPEVHRQLQLAVASARGTAVARAAAPRPEPRRVTGRSRRRTLTRDTRRRNGAGSRPQSLGRVQCRFAGERPAAGR